MELHEEQIEQMAHVAYESQRTLVISRGLSALNDDVPRPWPIALDREKHLQRMAVLGFWNEVKTSGVVRSEGRGLEELLAGAVVAAFYSALLAREKARQGN